MRPLLGISEVVPEERLAYVYECNSCTRAELDAYNAARAERQRAEALSAEADRIEAENRRIESLSRLAGIPERYLAAPIDGTAAPILDSGRGIWWHGPVGCGKTFAACAALRGWLRLHGGGARFVAAPSLLTELRSTYDGQGSEQAVVAKYSRCPVLLIDDLGKEAPTDWSLSKLYEIVDARWAASLPTCVTSNHSPSQLARRLAKRGDAEAAEAVVSRLAGTCQLVEMGGTDRRL